MTAPTSWDRTHSFTNELGDQHGINLDQELDNGRLAVREIRANLGLIQRDDGALQNDSVTPDSLDSATIALINSENWVVRGPWLIVTLYNVGDIVEVGATGSFIAVTQHISGASFAIDKAAGKWVTLSGVTAAELSSTANGFGASLIGIEDAGAYYAGDNVEDALQEVGASLLLIERTFATIALMKAATARRALERVSVLGYADEGDGGGGVFYWDSASVASDNGGTIIIPNAGGTGRWIRVVDSQTMNVRWFGAVGVDGTDDYTTAVNNARSVSSSLHFPAGRFRFTDPIEADDGEAMEISGAGSGVTFLQPEGSFDVIVFAGSSLGAGGAGGGIRDLTIDATGMSSGNAVVVRFYDRCIIRDIIITDGYNGIYVQDQNVTTINNVWMNNQTGQYGIKYYSASSSLSNVLDIDNVQLGFATNDASSPIGIWLDGGVSTVDIRHAAVVKGYRGLQITNTPNLVEGPQFVTAYDFQSDFPYAEGIYVNGGTGTASVSIHRYTDCYVHGSLTEHGVVTTARTRDVQFKGGFFSGNFKSGFSLDGRFSKLLGAQIANNSIAGLDVWPSVLIGANSLTTQIHNNFIGQFVGYATEKSSNAVKILAGAQRYSIKDNNFLGYDTKYDVLDQAGFLNDSASETSPNTHQINDQAFVVYNPDPSGIFAYTMGRFEKLIINPAANLAAFTVTAAATPPHGQEAWVICYHDVATFAFNPNTTVVAQTVDPGAGAVVALTANTAVAWKYNYATAKWHRFL